MTQSESFWSLLPPEGLVLPRVKHVARLGGVFRWVDTPFRKTPAETSETENDGATGGGNEELTPTGRRKRKKTTGLRIPEVRRLMRTTMWRPGSLRAAPGAYRDTAEKVREFIKKTAEIGKVLKRHGLTFNYHNHDFEFHKLPDCDKTMMDLLLEETDPELFHFIPDVAWIHYGGSDPVEVLNKMKGRVKVIHFKDYIIDDAGERKFVSLGKGKVDLKACFEAAKELEMPYIMYEQDCDWVDGDAFKATEESWAFMQSLLK